MKHQKKLDIGRTMSDETEPMRRSAAVIWYFFNGSNDSPCQSYLRQLLAMK
jgi:hypothetical protein